MAVPERGLYDSDEDLQAYLARMFTPPEPVKTGYEHVFSPDVQARINAEVQPGYRDPKTGSDVPRSITPTAGVTLGPLSLDGGLQLQQATTAEGNPYTKATPNLGVGLKVPLFDGEAELKAKYTPEQMKLLEAEWKKKLLGGELSLYGNYSQSPGEAPPAWGVGIRGSFPFNGGLR